MWNFRRSREIAKYFIPMRKKIASLSQVSQWLYYPFLFPEKCDQVGLSKRREA